jgi:hypothetical protein
LDRPLPLSEGAGISESSRPLLVPASFFGRDDELPLPKGPAPTVEPPVLLLQDKPAATKLLPERAAKEQTTAAKPVEDFPSGSETLLPKPAALGEPVFGIDDNPSDCTICPDDGCCLGPDKCGCFAPYRFWVRSEYLLWITSRTHTPPLLTTSPPTSLGVLGMPGTEVLYGGRFDPEEQSGGRFSVGVWFDRCQRFGWDGSFFFLGQRTLNFTDASNGTPLLARPFFNTVTNMEDSQLVANPVIPSLPNVLPLTGSITISQQTQLWGADTNAVLNLFQSCDSCYRLDLLLGARFLRLDDTLTIGEHLLVPQNSPNFAGATFDVSDRFATRNQFYGGQIGLRQEFGWRNWRLDLSTKLALGDTHERVDIAGGTIITPAGGAPTSFNGGLLAQPTNSGRFSRDKFSVVPEVGLNLGYQFNDHWRLFVGYNFLYWSDVVRPGDQIDRAVNPTQLPRLTGSSTLVGPARPAFMFNDRDFWAQGVNFGVEFRY